MAGGAKQQMNDLNRQLDDDGVPAVCLVTEHTHCQEDGCCGTLSVVGSTPVSHHLMRTCVVGNQLQITTQR